MADSSIQWTDRVWNPTVGCSIRSPGCKHCYAMRMARRLELMGQEKYRGLTTMTKAGAVWNGVVRLDEDSLDAPLHWKKPKRIFVNSMSDMAHEALSVHDIDKLFDVMHAAHWHTFQPLTKREDVLLDYMKGFAARRTDWATHSGLDHAPWPLRNVHLGLSIEDPDRLAIRGPVAVELAAMGWMTWFSIEPLLEGVDVRPFLPKAPTPDSPGVRWVVVGGESGSGARPFNIQWARDIVAQCRERGVPVFVKQFGANVRDRNDAGFEGCEPHEWPDIDPADIEHDVNGYQEEYQGAEVRIRLKDRTGSEMREWPEDLRIREFPA